MSAKWTPTRPVPRVDHVARRECEPLCHPILLEIERLGRRSAAVPGRRGKCLYLGAQRSECSVKCAGVRLGRQQVARLAPDEIRDPFGVRSTGMWKSLQYLLPIQQTASAQVFQRASRLRTERQPHRIAQAPCFICEAGVAADSSACRESRCSWHLRQRLGSAALK